MGIFNIFKKKNDDDNQEIPLEEINTSQNLPSESSELDSSNGQQIKRDEKADLEQLLAIDKKLERNRTIREAHQKKIENEEVTVKKVVTQRPEEIRARQALSIKNPFRGV